MKAVRWEHVRSLELRGFLSEVEEVSGLGGTFRISNLDTFGATDAEVLASLEEAASLRTKRESFLKDSTSRLLSDW